MFGWIENPCVPGSIPGGGNQRGYKKSSNREGAEQVFFFSEICFIGVLCYTGIDGK